MGHITADSQDKSHPSKHTAKLLGSAVAGVSELAVFHPVDTVAKRLMSNKKVFAAPDGVSFTQRMSLQFSFLRPVVFREAAEQGAFRRVLSLYPGLDFAAWYKISQRVYKFGGQPVVNELMQKSSFGTSLKTAFGDKNGKVMSEALSGMMIGIGEVMLLPFDVLKIKSQTNPEALRGRGFFSIVRQEGLVKLYAGAGWTAMRNAPGSLALFGASAFTLSHVLGVHDRKKATVVDNFISSAVGGVCSVLVASPLDVVKTRIQRADFQSGASGFQIARSLIREEGFGAFFKGLVPKVTMVAPKVVFSFTIAKSMISYFEQVME
jgi:hypothetical protein